MTQEGYTRIADQFDKTRQYSWGDFSVFDSLVKDGMRVLDVGCGNGRLFQYLQNRNISYVGIDANHGFITIARQTYSGHPTKPKFFLCDMSDIDVILSDVDIQFDMIFGIAVLHHIPTHAFQLQVLKNIKKFLKPEGILVLENWNLLQLGKGTKTVWHSCVQRNLAKKLPWETQYGISRRDLSISDVITQWGKSENQAFLYYHAFTLRELSSLLTSSGYHIRTGYYIRDGKEAHWWNGKNSIMIATICHPRPDRGSSCKKVSNY